MGQTCQEGEERAVRRTVDWKEYNEELVVRGEFYLDFEFVKNWNEELKEMNRGKGEGSTNPKLVHEVGGCVEAVDRLQRLRGHSKILYKAWAHTQATFPASGTGYTA